AVVAARGQCRACTGRDRPCALPREGAMASRLSKNGSVETRHLLAALRSIKNGDFSVRLPADQAGGNTPIAEAFNEVAELLENSTREFDRIGAVVGKEGRIHERASLGAPGGSWAAWVRSLNTLIGDLVRPTEEVARVIGAVAKGDLSQRIELET